MKRDCPPEDTDLAAATTTADFGTSAQIVENRPSRTISNQFLLAVAVQCVYVALACATILLLPFFNHAKFQTFAKHWPAEYKMWESEFSTWDAGYYFKIAQHGYARGDNSAAFYPAWPFILRAVRNITGAPYSWVGVILANLFLAAALVNLHRILRTAHGSKIATDTCALMMVFPGALFFHVPYTESLFLLEFVLLLVAIQRNAFLGASAIAFCLPLTRAVGIFTIMPLAYLFLSRSKRFVWPIAACFLGYGSYFWLMQAQTGSPFSGFAAQLHFPSQPSISNIFHIGSFLGRFSSVTPEHTMLGSPIDRMSFMLFCWMLPLLFKIDRLGFIFAVSYGLIPALSNQLMSYTRFSSINIPIFVAGAYLLSSFGTTVRTIIFCSFSFVQALLLARHLNFYWAN